MKTLHKLPIVSTLGLSLALSCAASARTPISGLGVAASPDGKTISLAGTNRTLYTVDASSFKVTKRTPVNTSVVALAYNKDGSLLWLSDTSDNLIAVNSADGSVKHRLKNCRNFTAMTSANAAAVIINGKLTILSLTDGSIKSEHKLPNRTRIEVIGLSSDGKTVACLSNSSKSKTEKKVSYRDIPKDLKGVARAEFEQKNDGRSSTIFTATVGNAELKSAETFYTTSGTSEAIVKDGSLYVVGYSNKNALIKSDGSATISQLESSYNYGIGWSHDGSLVAGGGLRSFSVANSADGKVSGKGKIGRVDGWPEYFSDFSAVPNGRIFGSTSAYRLIELDKSGKVIKEVSVY